ncbi:hypothetical protein K3495_g6704 [Podosphaera aphanis]|nr:hypothetical protein K3495_g6704 [Podosphaera aphanis]
MACPATHRAAENNPLATELETRLKDCHDTPRKCSDNPDLSDKDPDKSDDGPAETKEERARYRLIYRRFAGPFSKSLRGNRYFLQVIDNWTRRTWSIPIKTKDRAISELRQLRVKEERQTGRKLKSTRSDNAPELKHIMLQWERKDGVVSNFTAIASSHQNGPAERSIQIAEMAIRTMIDDAELPIEF